MGECGQVYVYEGGGSIGGDRFDSTHVALLDATSDKRRSFQITSSAALGRMAAIVFAGKKLKEPIAWHGPIVMNTQEEIQQAFSELESGVFPPVRVPWDYKRAAARPKSDL